jgi:hypothetical protein
MPPRRHLRRSSCRLNDNEENVMRRPILRTLLKGVVPVPAVLSLAACVYGPPPPHRHRPPPPPVVYEQPPPPPAAYLVWQPGHWRWDGYRWVWDRGHYVRRPGY